MDNLTESLEKYIDIDRATKSLEILITFIIICIALQIIKRITLKIVANNQSIRFATMYDTKITFLGVVHHEIGHAILAILTGAKVTKIQLIKHGDRLGAVWFKPRGPKIIRYIQYTLVQLGPIILGQVQLLLISKILQSSNIEISIKNWKLLLIIILVQQIVYHMQISKQDFKNLIHGIVPQACIIYVIIYLLNIDLSLVKLFIETIAMAELVNIIQGLLLQTVAKILRV